MTDSPAPAPRRRWRSRVGWAAAAVAAVAAAVGWAEAAEWPFLAGPAERLLSRPLQRPVVFEGGASPRFELKLFGSLQLRSARLTVANAAWASPGPMVDARSLHVVVRWRDLLAWHSGRPLHLHRVTADGLTLALQRDAQGLGNWQRPPPPVPGLAVPTLAASPVTVGTLAVEQGRLTLADAQLDLTAQGTFAAPAPTADTTADTPRDWTLQASGQYRGQPLKATARAGAGLGGMALGADGRAVPVTVGVQAGRARLSFDGSLQGTYGRTWQGRFEVAGPSLAAVGQPFGLTLPTTADFVMTGQLRQHAGRSEVQVASARIGRSQLAGDFVYEARARPRPVLSGELRGRALWLQDLGPVVGTDGPQAADEPRALRTGRVLPDRAFDLPSLSRMDADVQVRLERFELGHPRLSAMRPLKAHLTVREGLLRIDDIDARMAEGRVAGQVQLDGRQDPARWLVDLRASGLRIETWVDQGRPAGTPPYVSGRLAGRLQLSGTGRSAAQLLARSDGRAWLVLRGGRLSHLAVEAAGLDIAQALGLVIKGDDALPVSCGAADLVVKAGVVTPQVLLVDTRDSTLWAEGTVSLADEQMNLLLRVEPKDFSPLALRTPLHVRGTLSAPTWSIEKEGLAKRLVPAALLSMLHPLAGLLALADRGDDTAQPAIEACRQVLARRPARGDL